MRKVSSRELLAEIGIECEQNQRISKVTNDIREVDAQSIFVAIQGVRFDSHVYIDDAKALGALTISNYGRGGNVEVANTKQIYGSLLFALLGNPQQFLTFIGVTGTNGKSSVSYAIYDGLRYLGYSCCLCSTDGIYIKEEKLPTANTTPSIEVLCSLIQRCVREGITHIIMEVSSHSLSQYRIQGICFDTFVYTNLGHDHLDFHSSFMEYRDAKEKGSEYVKEEGLIVLGEDPLIQSMAHYLNTMYLCVGKGSYAYSYTWLESGVHLRFMEQSFHLPFTCDFQISNIVSAACVLLRFGEEKNIWAWMKLGSVISGRMECVYDKDFRIYIDYAHSVEAYEALGRNVERMRGEKWLVFGLGGERDTLKRSQIGQIVEPYFDCIILTSDNPRSENPYTICENIARKMSRKPHILINREEAIDYAISNVAKHGIIIVAGKGNETVMKMAEQTILFQDAEVIHQLLVKRGFIHAI